MTEPRFEAEQDRSVWDLLDELGELDIRVTREDGRAFVYHITRVGEFPK